MSGNISEIVEFKDINIDTIQSVLKNTGMTISQRDENSFYANTLGINSIVSVNNVFILIIVPFSIKDECDVASLEKLISNINKKLMLGELSINSHNKLLFTMSYMTNSGFYIPHLASTMAAFFASIKVLIKNNDLSEFIQ
ncbi:hypothetical protein WKC53_08650 [Morganella morganii]|uniref:hypothetical protein n=1 Tax=Morganella morganii TaxID=582 RepID=UPI0030FEE31D